jgi:glycosyltransferase involved in cell wall biosynthesis
LKILYVTAADLSAGGGDIEHVLGISASLAALGHGVHLVARGRPPIDGTASLRASFLPRHSSLLAELNSLGRLAVRTGQSYKPDVIYLRAFPLDYPLVVRRILSLRCPIAVELNTILAREYGSTGRRLRGSVFGRFERLTLRHADGWVGVTDEILDAAGNSAKDSRPTHIALNGYDAEHVSISHSRHDVRTEIGVDPDRPVLVMAGFSRPWHGVDRAVALLASLPADVELWLVGAESTADRANVERLSDAWGTSDRVRIWGWLPADETSAIVQAADVGLGPLALDRKGMRQAQPIKVRKYLALGLPVLQNYIDPMLPPSLPFVESVTTANPVALAAPALRLLSIGQRMREEIRTFALMSLTWRRAATETAAFLNELVAGQSGTSPPTEPRQP